MKNRKKLLVVEVAGLGWNLVHQSPEIAEILLRPIQEIFPALTCTVQASIRTALPPEQHGMLFNGVYQRDLCQPFFWHQSAQLVNGKRIWDSFRQQGGRVGMLFWQQSLGESVDLLLSPWPVHRHRGGIIDHVYTYPQGIYEYLCRQVRRPFHLIYYWGPFAQVEASRWIADVTLCILHNRDLAPDLLFTYLPHLDYTFQKYPENHPKSIEAVRELGKILERLIDGARNRGYEVIIFGDYQIHSVKEPLYPNLRLKMAGLFKTRKVKNMEYHDFYHSRVVCLVDHELAFLYLRDLRDRDVVEKALAPDAQKFVIIEQKKCNSAPGAGERWPDLILVAKPGYWFHYRWWTDSTSMPDFATHVDIHQKPGYDPCELFSDWNPFRIDPRPERIQGSHGRVGESSMATWGTSINDPPMVHDLLGLARWIQRYLEDRV